MSEQQESVNVSVSRYESAASSSNGIVKTVSISPKTVERWEKQADSLSLNSATFKIPVSANMLYSRRIILEMPVSLTATGTTKLKHFYACPRADALNRIIANCSIRANGGTVVSSPGQFCEVVGFFNREASDFHNSGLLSSTPAVPDIVFGRDVTGYDGGADTPDNTDNLRDYHWRSRSYDQSYSSRASVCNFTKTGVTAAKASDTGDLTSTLKFVLRCALKNPVLSSSSYETLSNLNDLEVTLNFMSASFLKKLFFRPEIYQHPAGPTDLVTNVTATISQDVSEVKLIGFAIQPTLLDMIPSVSLLPANEFLVFDQAISTVQDFATDGKVHDITHSNLSLSQVPSLIMLSVVPAESALSDKMSDYYCPIDNVTLNINDRSFVFNQYKARDFYALACANGYKSTFKTYDSSRTETGTFNANSFEMGIGGPVVWACENIGNELKPGLLESFKAEFRYKFRNTTGVAMAFTSRVTFVMDQTIVLSRSSPLRILNGIDQAEFNNAVAEGSYVTLGNANENEQDLLLGGSISSMFREASRMFIRGLNLGTQVLNTASALYPEIPGKYAQEFNRANALSQQLNRDLNLGGSMLAGANNMSRIDLMRAQGLIR
jgi:hypothetical protein